MVAQRRYKRSAKRLKEMQPPFSTNHHTIKTQLTQTKTKCLTSFGFWASPELTLQKNFNNTLKKLDTPPQYLQPKNLAFHNLCKNNTLPPGSKALLGLNLKFCLSNKTITNDISKTMLQLARSIRIQYYLMETGTTNDSTYEKQIYVKNTNWHPPPAPWAIEEKITDFEKALRQKHQSLVEKHQKINITNLTPIQAKAMRLLKNNKDIIIKPTDKNLGPAIMDTPDYVHQILTEHLLTNDYRQLSRSEAENKMDQLRKDLDNLLSANAQNLSQSEITYFKRSLSSRFRLPIFYGLPKVHKTPVSLRPVVSTTNSLLAVFSTWLDYKMKVLLPLVKSHIHNSIEVIQALKNIQIPKKALLFSADAVSMYTNIDTPTGVSAIRDFLLINREQIPESFPTDLFLQVLETVMNNNIFSFADTFWHQLSGTAMGTPTACAYATITYGHFENTEILPRFSNQLLYYKRYIDDIFGIWIPPEYNASDSWSQFKQLLNSWGNLKWKIEEPSLQTVFLDLNINLHNGRITTSTFQKQMNLYLYLPPLSAHPPSCLKGLIAGEMRRYWLQNSPKGYESILLKFIERLLDRGHTLPSLTPIITQAAQILDKNPNHISKDKDINSNTLYIHRTYHPCGLKRRDIRQIFDKTLQPHLPFKRMTVAVSRPLNLRDILTKTKLQLPASLDIKLLIEDIKSRDNATADN
jgi:hypothetical protein